MKTRVSLLSMAVLGAIAFSACAEKKQLTEMHDSTQEMRDITKELRDISKNMDKTTTKMSADTEQVRAQTDHVSGSTDKVLDKTEEMRRITAELYDASRQGAALLARRDLLDSMLKDQSSGKKVADAGKYFMAFEFQLWNEMGLDKLPDKRLELMTAATAEFFKDVKEFVVEGAARPFAQASEGKPLSAIGNKAATFNAISAAMHRLNRKQEDVLKELAGHQIQGVSMYSMISDGLKAEKDLKQGRLESSRIPQYQKDVIVNRDVAIQLLQSRMNFIAAIFLNETVDRKTWSGMWNAGLNRYLSWGRTWTLNLDSYSQPQVEQFSTYLKGSLKTKQLLIDLGIKPEMNKGIQAFFNGLDIQSQMKGTGALLAANAELKALVLQMKDVKEAPQAQQPAPKPQQAPPPTVPQPKQQSQVQAPVKVDPVDPNAVPAPEKKPDVVVTTQAPATGEPAVENGPAQKKPGVVSRTWTKIKDWWNKKPEQAAPPKRDDQPQPEPQAPVAAETDETE